MFETANYYISNRQIEGGNKLFPWKCYLEHEFIYSDGAKNSWLGESYCRAKDTTGQFNTLELDKTKTRNDGFIKRKEWLKDGRKMRVRIVLPFDIARSGRLLPSGVPVRIELKRSPTAFCLMADSTTVAISPVLKIEDPMLHVERVKLYPTIVDALRRKLENGSSCKYVFDRIHLTNATSVPIGASQMTMKVTNGQTPSVILAFFVDAKGYNGSFTNNCFLLENLNVIEASAVFLGDTYPTKPYSLKFDGVSGANYNVTNMYTELQRALGFWQSNYGNSLTLEEFAHDNCIFPFILSSENKVNNYSTPVQTGQVTLDFKFKEPLKIEKMLVTACFMQSAAYISRGGACWTSYISNTTIDEYRPGG